MREDDDDEGVCGVYVFVLNYKIYSPVGKLAERAK